MAGERHHDQRRRPGRVRGLLLDQRLRPIWILLFFGWLLFSCFRLALFLARRAYIHDLGAARTALCFLLGMRFDLMVLGYVLLPMVLALSLAPDRWFQTRWFPRSVTIYGVVVVTLGILGETIGAAFFLYENFRLGRRMHYLTDAGTMMGFIWVEYPVWLLIPGALAIIYASYWFLRRRFAAGGLATTWPWRRPIQAVVLGALCILAGRGGFGRRPLQEGTAYAFQNRLVVQLTMNNFYTLYDALRDELRTLWWDEDSDEEFPYPPVAEARRTVRAMVYGKADRPVPGGPNFLWRRVETGRPRKDYNVVVLVMEGMSCEPVGALGYSPSFTPHFDRLCREGLFLDRMYAAGPRTNNGLVAVLCGHPDLLKPMSVLKDAHAQGHFITLPREFKRRGYETMFLYGGTGEFDDMNVFFSPSGGVDRFINKAAMAGRLTPEMAKIKTFDDGVPDEIALQAAADEFDRMAGRPFFAVILTMSNHKPYGIPPNRPQMLHGHDEDTQRFNAYRYSDWALGDFFRRVRERPWFKRTIFVLVADHAHNVNPVQLIDVPRYRIPCVFYAPDIIKPPRRVSTICSQTDVGPTLLALLGGTYQHCFMGRDILSVDADDGFAALQGEGLPGFIRGNRALIVPPLPRNVDFPIPVLFRVDKAGMEPIALDKTDPEQVDLLQLQLLSYYAVARDLFKSQTYRSVRPMPTTQPVRPGRTAATKPETTDHD